MVDPIIEPDSGETWQVLYSRLWPLYLDAMAVVRDQTDRVGLLEERLRDCVHRTQAGAPIEAWPWFDLYKERL